MPTNPPSDDDATALACGFAHAVGEIGKPGFSAALLEAIAGYCTFDCALIVLYAQRRRPDILLDQLYHATRTNSAEHYVAGAYLLDPFYIWSRGTNEPALLRMRDIAPRDFDTSEYFVSYYKQSNVVDEVNYLVPVEDGRIYAVSLERSSQLQPFSDSEVETLASWLPFIASLVRRHVSMPEVRLPANLTDKEHDRLVELLGNFGADVLTARECKVVQLMLNGYSAGAIASLLEVSVETVRVHRRNIYTKLNISSLAELFALALKAIYSGEMLSPR
ncbi:MAG: hypothetical protein H6884_08620 [Rhodobiaceae bacterium]|nr:hypothetical protein [Rhodobiaceae bacterium]MCC0054107.1 hypothetical protein [Rhodobiaceae bacterium]